MERVSSDDVKLYQVSDESGSMTTEQVMPSNGGGLTGDLLNVRKGHGRSSPLEDVVLGGRNVSRPHACWGFRAVPWNWGGEYCVFFMFCDKRVYRA